MLFLAALPTAQERFVVDPAFTRPDTSKAASLKDAREGADLVVTALGPASRIYFGSTFGRVCTSRRLVQPAGQVQARR